MSPKLTKTHCDILEHLHWKERTIDKKPYNNGNFLRVIYPNQYKAGDIITIQGWPGDCCLLAGNYRVVLHAVGLKSKAVFSSDERYIDIFIPYETLDVLGYSKSDVEQYISLLRNCNMPIELGDDEIGGSMRIYNKKTCDWETNSEKCCVIRIKKHECQSHYHVMYCLQAIAFLQRPQYNMIPYWTIKLKSRFPEFTELECLLMAHYCKDNCYGGQVTNSDRYFYRHICTTDSEYRIPYFVDKNQVLSELSYIIDKNGFVATHTGTINNTMHRNGVSKLTLGQAFNLFAEEKFEALHQHLIKP